MYVDESAFALKRALELNLKLIRANYQGTRLPPIRS